MSFLFESVERFVAGTVGQPGERAFFIQARHGNRLVTVAVEKLQVAALAERVELIINEFRKSDSSIRLLTSEIDDAPLELPIESEFEVGSISISWDESKKMMSIELLEIVTEEIETPNTLEVQLSISMCIAFIKRSKALIGAGRLPCPFCGMPIDPQGHLCPRANGYRR
ncbi:MAG: methyltransferase [Actinobacteria bacterium]|nr:methyltransferase [Actinomycetota bacterium]